MASLELITRQDQLAFFSPEKKTHLNRANQVLPHVIFWARLSELGLYSQALDKIFSKHELGQKFKSALLVETNSSYSNSAKKTFCKKYQVNKQNLIELLKRTVKVSDEQEPAICSPVFADQDEEIQHWAVRYYRTLYADELTGKKPFQYVEKSYRKWHPIQNVRRSHKQQVFAGYLDHDYDISTALISVMLGDVQKLDSRFDRAGYHLVFDYRDNKAEIRKTVGEVLGLDADAVKELFSYINNNGVISTSPFRALMNIVGNDKAKVAAIRKNKFFKAYIRQIKSLWSIWVSLNNTQVAFTENIEQRPLVEKKKRFALYFYNERKLLDSIEKYLQLKSAIYFLEHDGFRTNLKIDQVELEKLIKEQVQIEVEIEQK